MLAFLAPKTSSWTSHAIRWRHQSVDGIQKCLIPLKRYALWFSRSFFPFLFCKGWLRNVPLPKFCDVFAALSHEGPEHCQTQQTRWYLNVARLPFFSNLFKMTKKDTGTKVNNSKFIFNDYFIADTVFGSPVLITWSHWIIPSQQKCGTVRVSRLFSIFRGKNCKCSGSAPEISRQNIWSNGKRPIFPINLFDKYMNFNVYWKMGY